MFRLAGLSIRPAGDTRSEKASTLTEKMRDSLSIGYDGDFYTVLKLFHEAEYIKIILTIQSISLKGNSVGDIILGEFKKAILPISSSYQLIQIGISPLFTFSDPALCPAYNYSLPGGRRVSSDDFSQFPTKQVALFASSLQLGAMSTARKILNAEKLNEEVVKSGVVSFLKREFALYSQSEPVQGRLAQQYCEGVLKLYETVCEFKKSFDLSLLNYFSESPLVRALLLLLNNETQQAKKLLEESTGLNEGKFRHTLLGICYYFGANVRYITKAQHKIRELEIHLNESEQSQPFSASSDDFDFTFTHTQAASEVVDSHFWGCVIAIARKDKVLFDFFHNDKIFGENGKHQLWLLHYKALLEMGEVPEKIYDGLEDEGRKFSDNEMLKTYFDSVLAARRESKTQAPSSGAKSEAEAKPEPKPEGTKSKEPKPEVPKAEGPKPEDPKPEKPKPEGPKPEDPKPEKPKPEEPKPEKPKAEGPKPEDPKPEKPKPEKPKPEKPKPEDPKTEKPKAEEPKPEEPKPKDPKPEGPKPKDPKPEGPKPKLEPKLGKFPEASLRFILNIVTELNIIEMINSAQKGTDTWLYGWLKSTIAGYVPESNPVHKIISSNLSLNLVLKIISNLGQEVSKKEIVVAFFTDRKKLLDLRHARYGRLAELLNHVDAITNYLLQFSRDRKNFSDLDPQILMHAVLNDENLEKLLEDKAVVTTLANLCESVQVEGFNADEARKLFTLILELQKKSRELQAKTKKSFKNLFEFTCTLLIEDKQTVHKSLVTVMEIAVSLQKVVNIFLDPLVNPIQLTALSVLQRVFDQLAAPDKKSEVTDVAALLRNKAGELQELGPFVATPLQAFLVSKDFGGYTFKLSKDKKATDGLSIYCSNQTISSLLFEQFVFANSIIENLTWQNVTFKQCDFKGTQFNGDITLENVYIDYHTARTFFEAIDQSNCTIKGKIVLIGSKPDGSQPLVFPQTKARKNLVVDVSVGWAKIEEIPPLPVFPSEPPKPSTVPTIPSTQTFVAEGVKSQQQSMLGGFASVMSAMGSSLSGYAQACVDNIKSYAAQSSTSLDDMFSDEEDDEMLKTDTQSSSTAEAVESVKKQCSELEEKIRKLNEKQKTEHTETQDELATLTNQLQELQTWQGDVKTYMDEKFKHKKELEALRSHESPQVRIYFQTLYFGLSSAFQALLVLHSGFIQGKTGAMTDAANKQEKWNDEQRKRGYLIQTAGKNPEGVEFVLECLSVAVDHLLPIMRTGAAVLNVAMQAGLAVASAFVPGAVVPAALLATSKGLSAAGSPIDALIGLNESKFQERQKRAFSNLSAKTLERLAAMQAIKITNMVKRMIVDMKLSEKGAVRFARDAVDRILASLFNGYIVHGENFMNEACVALRLVRLTQPKTLIGIAIPFTEKNLDILPPFETQVSADNLYRMSLMSYQDDEFVYYYYACDFLNINQYSCMEILEEEFPVYKDHLILKEVKRIAPKQEDSDPSQQSVLQKASLFAARGAGKPAAVHRIPDPKKDKPIEMDIFTMSEEELSARSNSSGWDEIQNRNLILALLRAVKAQQAEIDRLKTAHEPPQKKGLGKKR